jgi:hypothetical protein
MKRMKIYMVSLFLVTALFCNAFVMYSQDAKLSRQERKEVRKAAMTANFNILDSLLNAKSFVLVADYLRNTYGNVVPVVPSLNFIRVSNTKGVLQTGANDGMGYNGVGGVTAEGNLAGYKIYKDFKNMTYTLRFNLTTNIGIYDVLMTVNAANNASATITGLGPGNLTWQGHLETINNSRVFKGFNTI